MADWDNSKTWTAPDTVNHTDLNQTKDNLDHLYAPPGQHVSYQAADWTIAAAAAWQALDSTNFKVTINPSTQYAWFWMQLLLDGSVTGARAYWSISVNGNVLDPTGTTFGLGVLYTPVATSGADGVSQMVYYRLSGLTANADNVIIPYWKGWSSGTLRANNNVSPALLSVFEGMFN